jgi:hypothetical protein
VHFSASGLFDWGVGLRLASPLRLTGKPPRANDVIQILLKISRSDSPGLWGKIRGTVMRFVIGIVVFLVLGSVFGSIAGLLFWPQLSSGAF